MKLTQKKEEYSLNQKVQIFKKSEYISQDAKELYSRVPVDTNKRVTERFNLYRDTGIIEEETHVETEQKISSEENPCTKAGFPEEMVKQIDEYLNNITRMRDLNDAFDVLFKERKKKSRTDRNGNRLVF